MNTPIFLIRDGMKGLLANIKQYEDLKGSMIISEEDRIATLNDLYQDRYNCFKAIEILNSVKDS